MGALDDILGQGKKPDQSPLDAILGASAPKAAAVSGGALDDILGGTHAPKTTADRVAEMEQAAKTAKVGEYAPGMVGWLERVLQSPLSQMAGDIISRPNYAVAGAFDEMVQGKGPGAAAVRASRELMSGIGGIKGDKERFGQVFEQASVPTLGSVSDLGILPSKETGQRISDFIMRPPTGGFPPYPADPTGISAAVARNAVVGGPLDITGRGTLGLVLDIAADPLTYMTAGTGSGARLATKEGVKVLSKAGTEATAETIARLAPDLAKGARISLEGLSAEGKAIAEKAAQAVGAERVKDTLRLPSSADLELRLKNQKMIADAAQSSPAFQDAVDMQARNLLNAGFEKNTPEFAALQQGILKEAQERTLEAAKTNPRLLDRGGIKFAGVTVPGTPAAATAISATAQKALVGLESAPLIANAVKAAEKGYDLGLALFSRDSHLKGYPGAALYKQAHLDAHSAMMGKTLRQVEESEAFGWYRSQPSKARPALAEKMVRAAEKGDYSNLSKVEADLAQQFRQHMDDMAVKEYEQELLTGTRPNYVAHYYENPQHEWTQIFPDTQGVTVWRGKKVDFANLGKHDEERVFDTLGDAVDAAEEEAARVVAAGGKRPPKLMPIWDPIEILVRRADAHAKAITSKSWHDFLKQTYGKEVPFNLEDYYPGLNRVRYGPVAVEEQAKIENHMRRERTAGMDSPDLDTARAAIKSERDRLTPRASLKSEKDRLENLNEPAELLRLKAARAGLAAAAPKPRPVSLLVTKAEIPYYEKQGYTFIAKEGSRFRVMAPAGIESKKSLRHMATMQGLDARLRLMQDKWDARLAESRARLSEIRTDLRDWDMVDEVTNEIKNGTYGYRTAHNADEANKFLASLSPDGRRDFMQQRMQKVASKAELDGVLEKYSSAARLLPEQTRPIPQFDAYGNRMVYVNDVKHLQGVQVPPAIAADIEDMGGRTFTQKEVRAVIDGWDKANNLFKSYVTVAFPAFHFRNAYSNVAQSFLDIGLGALDPRQHYHTIRVLAGKDGELVTKMGVRYSYDEIRQIMREHRVIVTGADIAELTGKRATYGGRIPQAARNAGAVIENEARAQLFMNHLRRGSDPMMAAARMKEFLFDYQNLSRIEKDILRRFIPFYTWTRKNIALQVKMLRTRPGMVAAEIKPFAGRESEDQKMVSFEGGALKIRLDSDGKTIRTITGVDLPFRNLDMVWNGGWGNTAARWMGTITPYFKVPMEVGAGSQFFTRKPFGRRESQAAGRLVEQLPKPIQSLMRLHVEKDAAGRTHYTMDEERFYVFAQSWIFSRLVSTTDRQFKSIFDNGASASVALDLLTGLRDKELNLTDQQEKMLKEREKYLGDLLYKAGIYQKYENTYQRKAQ